MFDVGHNFQEIGFGVFFSFFSFLACLSYPSLTVGQEKEEKVLRLYHDADWVNSIESSESIRKGVETALSEVNHIVQGFRVELVKKNHSSNVVRSLKNMHDFLKDENAIALVSGMHSPPLIKHRDFINENKILTLVPWAAGGAITRYPSEENWIFRVSIDDTKAGKVLVDYALENKRCKKISLLLEDTSWGKSNLNIMTQAFQQHGYSNFNVIFFNLNIKSYTAQDKVQDIVSKNSDCVLLVSNVLEGIQIAKAIASITKNNRLSIISHWGITGGQFHKEVSNEIRKKIDLTFIQTCFSFLSSSLSNHGQHVFSFAKNKFPESIKTYVDITAPAGFIHGYDIARILIQAINEVHLNDDMNSNRNKVRLALENLKKPVNGLIKTYKRPFSQFSKKNIDAHEALGVKDFCMAKYGESNEIKLITE